MNIVRGAIFENVLNMMKWPHHVERGVSIGEIILDQSTTTDKILHSQYHKYQ